MLISMPTDTSTILGAFQVILFSLEIRRELRTEAEPKTASDIAQARKIESRTPADQAYRSIFLSKTRQFLFWTRPRFHGPSCPKLPHGLPHRQASHWPMRFPSTRNAITNATCVLDEPIAPGRCPVGGDDICRVNANRHGSRSCQMPRSSRSPAASTHLPRMPATPSLSDCPSAGRRFRPVPWQ